jgi:quinoprotein glucose dehydrogenase
VVALKAKNGEVVWGFQLVHHDLWDYDTTTSPLLATLDHDHKKLPVVIAGNKTGFLYVLNRETGVPVFSVEERSVPQSDVPGEVSSRTQPFPVLPPPLVPQRFSPSEIWAPNAADREACLKMVEPLRNEGIFTPPSLRGSLAIPGNVGGMNWSGYAFDPVRSLLFVNVNNLPAMVKLVPRGQHGAQEGVWKRSEYAEQAGSPYGMMRRLLQGPSGLPFPAPPWGTLVAVDMVEGKFRWQVPLGGLAGFGKDVAELPPGSISLGGPIVTAGGLVFIAGTVDPFIRAFDVESGKELWKAHLPASGAATPSTYLTHVGGKQFLVIAAGGHAKVTEESQSDALVAFALP